MSEEGFERKNSTSRGRKTGEESPSFNGARKRTNSRDLHRRSDSEKYNHNLRAKRVDGQETGGERSKHEYKSGGDRFSRGRNNRFDRPTFEGSEKAPRPTEISQTQKKRENTVAKQQDIVIQITKGLITTTELKQREKSRLAKVGLLIQKGDLLEQEGEKIWQMERVGRAKTNTGNRWVIIFGKDSEQPLKRPSERRWI